MNLFSETFKSGTFTSTKHQRYENGAPVMGLQNCNRGIQIDKNINGCDGYKIPYNIGYIVTIFNLDGNHPIWRSSNVQMAPKPMKVIERENNRVLLRGYMTEARAPWGWVDYDLSNYGFEIIFNNSEIEKCILYMYDRNVRIEYYK